MVYALANFEILLIFINKPFVIPIEMDYWHELEIQKTRRTHPIWNLIYTIIPNNTDRSRIHNYVAIGDMN